jgi:hypothetical protein
VPSLEERVTALEARVEDLATETRHRTDLAVMASREALTAREAHQKNIELLHALRHTQMEHGQRLDTIDSRLDHVDGKLGKLTVGMHAIEGLLRRLINDP